VSHHVLYVECMTLKANHLCVCLPRDRLPVSQELERSVGEGVPPGLDKLSDEEYKQSLWWPSQLCGGGGCKFTPQTAMTRCVCRLIAKDGQGNRNRSQWWHEVSFGCATAVSGVGVFLWL
jgi:hypothetical protein